MHDIETYWEEAAEEVLEMLSEERDFEKAHDLLEVAKVLMIIAATEI